MEDFPILYEAHHRNYQEDIPFWLDLVAKAGDPVLELGCGSGRVLIPIQHTGALIFGLDRDLGMLMLLRQKLLAPLVSADMTAIPLRLLFRSIILPCNTYSTLNASERKCLLNHIHGLMHPNGIFGVSLPNPWMMRAAAEFAETEIEEIIQHPIDGYPVQISNAWQRTSEQLIIAWHYDHLYPDGTVKRLTIEQTHYFQTPHEYEAEFKLAGLEVKAKYGDFNHSPFHRTSPYLIYLLHNKGAPPPV
ncbi:MAG: class I SAM-dependent methyltransferase [Anaerolineales bacterium]